MLGFASRIEKKHPDSSAAAWYAGLATLSAGLFTMYRQDEVHKNISEFLLVVEHLPGLEMLFSGGILFFLFAMVFQGCVALCRDLNPGEPMDANLVNTPRFLAAAGASCLMAASVWLFVLAFMSDYHPDWAQPHNEVDSELFSALWGSVFTVSALTFWWNATRIGETICPTQNKPYYN